MAHSKGKKPHQQKLSLKKTKQQTHYTKTIVLKMLKELQEDVEKVKKIMCERNGNMNKETGNLKGNSGAEKYNN